MGKITLRSHKDNHKWSGHDPSTKFAIELINICPFHSQRSRSVWEGALIINPLATSDGSVRGEGDSGWEWVGFALFMW